MEHPLWKIHWFRINELLNPSVEIPNLVGMRPLFHPAIEDVTVEGILYALSDPIRVAIFSNIAFLGRSENCSSFLTVGNQAIPKSTLSQHFRILRENGLIRGERHGVEMRNTSRCGEIDRRFPGLLGAIRSAYSLQMGESHAQTSAARRPAKRPRTQR